MAAGAKRCFNGCNLWPVIYRLNGFSSPAQTFLITFPYLSFWGWAGKKKILFKHNFLLESCHVEWDMLEEHSFLGPFGRSFHCTITIWWDATIIVAVRNVTHLLFLRGTPAAVLVHFLKTPWDRLMSVVLCPVLTFFSFWNRKCKYCIKRLIICYSIGFRWRNTLRASGQEDVSTFLVCFHE